MQRIDQYKMTTENDDKLVLEIAELIADAKEDEIPSCLMRLQCRLKMFSNELL